MKKYLYIAGTTALALTMSGVPLLAAHAQEAGSATVSAGAEGGGTYNGEMHPILRVAQGATTTGDRPALNPRLPEQPRPILEQERANASTTLQVRMPGEEGAEGAQTQEQERTGSTTVRAEIEAHIQNLIQKREDMIASNAENGQGNATSTAARLQNLANFSAHLGDMFGSSTPAQTVAELQQRIQDREQEVQGLLASSTPEQQAMLEHASRVSVAVHALLASRDLLGSGIGQQVSQLAQQVNDSLASTTDAQAQIQARGFWTKLFFGGDKQAAQTLQQNVAQNQERIQQITDLINQASTTAEVKVTLQTQLQALEQAQASTTEQASQQKGLWGLFSWRLF